jgi:hypothetical protein
MKALPASLFLTALAWVPQASAQSAADTQAWVRQTDLATGLVYDMPVAGTGTSNYIAPLPVPESGGRFELFAKGTAWDSNIYLLDTEFVYAYSPAAAMTLTSEDSYVRGDEATGNYVKRTRADRPYSVSIQITGLVPSSAVLAENSVYLGVKGRNFGMESYTAVDTTPYPIHEYNLSNGSVSLGPLYHELTENAVSYACGEQSFQFVRYASDGIPDTVIAEPKLEVWPVATATVDGIVQDQVFTDRIPPIPVTWKHLYPDSRTYVQIYAGTPVLGTQGTIIDSTERKYGRYYNPGAAEEPANVPQDVSLSIPDLSQYAAADGIYTVEVITETPFFNRTPERLYTVTFEVDRVISSRGQLSTTEKPTDAAPAPVTP